MVGEDGLRLIFVTLLGLVVRHLGDPSLLLVGGVLDGTDLVVGLQKAVSALHLVAFALFLLVLDVVGVLVLDGVFVVEFRVGLQQNHQHHYHDTVPPLLYL